MHTDAIYIPLLLLLAPSKPTLSESQLDIRRLYFSASSCFILCALTPYICDFPIVGQCIETTNL